MVQPIMAPYTSGQYLRAPLQGDTDTYHQPERSYPHLPTNGSDSGVVQGLLRAGKAIGRGLGSVFNPVNDYFTNLSPEEKETLPMFFPTLLGAPEATAAGLLGYGALRLGPKLAQGVGNALSKLVDTEEGGVLSPLINMDMLSHAVAHPESWLSPIARFATNKQLAGWLRGILPDLTQPEAARPARTFHKGSEQDIHDIHRAGGRK